MENCSAKKSSVWRGLTAEPLQLLKEGSLLQWRNTSHVRIKWHDLNQLFTVSGLYQVSPIQEDFGAEGVTPSLLQKDIQETAAWVHECDTAVSPHR